MPDTKRTATGVLGGLAGLVGLSAVAGVLVTATVTPAIALSGAAASSAITMFDNLPSVLEIDTLMLPTTIYAKDSEGKDRELTSFYDQNRSPVDYDGIAPVMYDAILSSEDPRYYEHGGIDLIGTTRAMLSNLKGGGEVQGGSSISQQYVKNVLIQDCERDAEAYEKVDADGNPVLDAEGNPVTVSRDEALLECWTAATTAEDAEGIQRKLQEMRYAIALEQKYSKEDILLGYLNIANFGGTTYGIDAAARFYFGVSAKDLSIAQSATLAGIVQNPNRYRIDMTDGSITAADGTTFNKAPDGEIEEAANLSALDALVASGDITEEQRLEAADGYTSTKVRQLYVLSRMLDDGKITREEYVAAAAAPISPKITAPKNGCGAAKGAEYFCQYVRYVIQRDPAFGATEEERLDNLRQGGLNVYTTLDWDLQKQAQATINDIAPQAVDGGTFGAVAASIEANTGRILTIAQNTAFTETDGAGAGKTSIVYAGDNTFGQSTGFNAGSTFKLFTLVNWLEEGHSVREVVNGTNRNMTTFPMSCTEAKVWSEYPGYDPQNFDKQRGYVGTPMQYTAQSLNTGYLAMAEQLDLCDILDTAAKMGVVDSSTGEPFKAQGPNQVIGSDTVSPIAIASAYATVANEGVYCEPQAIDRVTDAEGNEIAIPERSCDQVIDPKVAATAAYALQGVMNGGTGSGGNPYDGTQLIGKTGTHEQLQTWMVESSTRVATAAWVGNASGKINMFQTWTDKGYRLADLRYTIARDVQRVANQKYPAEAFPQPDSNLSRQVLFDLPNVVGKTVDEARGILESAGFQVVVGDPVDSTEAKDIVAEQSPGAGKVAGGTSVTISPSNGRGLSVPDVSGRELDRAISELRGAGFGNVQPGSCTDDDGNRMQATTTDPSAGTVVNRNTAITVNYTGDCDGSGTGPGNGGGGGGGDNDESDD